MSWRFLVRPDQWEIQYLFSMWIVTPKTQGSCPSWEAFFIRMQDSEWVKGNAYNLQNHSKNFIDAGEFVAYLVMFRSVLVFLFLRRPGLSENSGPSCTPCWYFFLIVVILCMLSPWCLSLGCHLSFHELWKLWFMPRLVHYF